MVYGSAPWTFVFRPKKRRSARRSATGSRVICRKNWTGDRFTRSDENRNVYRQFAERLATKQWVAPHWPVEYGGLGLSVIEQLIFNEEMSYANAPIGYSTIGVGWAGPTIIVYGTDEQKKQHLGAITDAETMWCQGF